MSKIVAVRRLGGEMDAFKLDDGRELTKDQAFEEAVKGNIEGVLVAHSRYGEPYLRTTPDATESNNFDSYPSF